ncbi:MAG: cytochrome c [Nannocystaceae bacterium]
MIPSPFKHMFGLLISIALVGAACDSGGEDSKEDPAKKAAAAEEAKKAADEAKAAAEAKAAEAQRIADEKKAADAKAAEAADTGGETEGGDEGGDEAAEDGGDEEGDEKGDSKAADKKADKKAADKKPEKKDAGPKIDGKPLFVSKCKSCHGDDGKGKTTIGEKLKIPSLAGSKLSQAKLIDKIANGVDGTKMKAFKGKLSDDEIKAIAAHIKKLK